MDILIVEDELLIAEMLKEMLIDLGYSNIYVTKSFQEAQDILLEQNTINLVFLDINLNDVKSGVDLGNFIKAEYGIPFIYLTSYSDPKTVKEAAASLPEAYLTKPFTKTDLFSTIEIIKMRSSLTETYSISIKDGYQNVNLPLSELLFIQSERNYLEIFTEEKRYTIRDSIENFINKLGAPKFIRVHRSYAVNIDKIDHVTSKSIKIKSESIPLSRNFKKEVMDSFGEQ